MVKKIGGKKPPGKTPETAPVQPTKTVSSDKVGGVKGVKSAEKKGAAAGVRGPAGRITPEQRDQLYQLIEEEADRLFGKDGLPDNRKETIKGAVRMVIDGSIIEEEEENAGT